MINLSIIAENLDFPFDEGVKKSSFHLIQSLSERANVTVFSRSQNLTFKKNVATLPKNRLFISHNFFKKIKTSAPDTILYIPESSGTLNSFLRAGILRLTARKVPVGIVNLQFRKLPTQLKFCGFRNLCNIVFVQSKASYDVVKSLGFKTVWIPGGVDLSTYHPVDLQTKINLRYKYGFSISDQIVLHVGHLNYERNIKLLKMLVTEGYKVIIITSTSTKQNTDLLKELKASGVIVINGYIEAIQHYYQLSDCYLFPVINSTSAIDAPLSVLEAMACNIPVVTTPFGALPIMFKPSQSFYFYDEVENLLPSIKNAIDVKQCNNSDVVKPFSWDNLATRIVNSLLETRLNEQK